MSSTGQRPATARQSAPRFTSRGGWRRALLLWLALALPIYATTGLQLRLFGPVHWHAPPAIAAQPGVPSAYSALSLKLTSALSALAGLETLQRLLQRLEAARELGHALDHARAHATSLDGLQGHPHTHTHTDTHTHAHSSLEHHWHDASDGTVRMLTSPTLDPAIADLVNAAGHGGASLTLALPEPVALSLMLPAGTHWPTLPPAGWRDIEPRVPTPPPQA